MLTLSHFLWKCAIIFQSMATRTKKITRKLVVKKEVAPASVVVAKKKLNLGWVKYVLIAALVVGYFWYKTNSWPVAAVVNGFPVMRFQLDQLMYQRVGPDALEELITKRLIEDELKFKRVKVSDVRVLEKLGEIKTQLGGDEAFNQALTYSGMTTEKLKEQIKWQLGLEALVETSTDSAVLQERVQQKVEELRQKAKVWKLTGAL